MDHRIKALINVNSLNVFFLFDIEIKGEGEFLYPLNEMNALCKVLKCYQKR